MFFKIKKKASADPPLLLTEAPYVGIFAGTRLAIANGWVPVENLSEGDPVLTVQDGEQEIYSIKPESLSVTTSFAAARRWPLLVPDGAIGNKNAMLISPDMRVVIEHKKAHKLFGSQAVSIRAQNLITYCGIARARVSGELPHYCIRFSNAQTVIVEQGMYLDIPASNGVFRFLPLDDRQARQLVRHMSCDTETETSNTSRPTQISWI